MTRKLEIEIVGDPRSAARAFKTVGRSANDLGPSIKRMAAGVAIGTLAVRGFQKAWDIASGALRDGIEEWRTAAQTTSQTEAAIRSTGKAANVTAEDVDRLSSSLLAKTGIDDEVIKSGENILLTFTQIRNEVGRGNDMFNQATKAATDLSVAMHIGLNQAALQVGKALNDPVRGMARLQRVGVAFTQAQKDQVAALMKTGDVLGAQKVIVAELNKEFGGSAKAFGRTIPGMLTILRESFNNLAGQLVSYVAPAFAKALKAASAFLSRLDRAEGLRAKIKVVWDGLSNAGRALTSKLGDAIRAVDWTAVWSKAKGIGAGLQARFESIDWSSVGGAIGTGLATGLAASAPAIQGLSDAVASMARSVDWVAFGREIGPGLAAALITAFATITDPAFWIKNWDLALAVAAVVFRGALLKLAGKLLAPLARLGSDIVLAIIGGIERFSPRVAAALLSAVVRLPGIVTNVLARLSGIVGSGFTRLGTLARFTIRVLGLQVAINAIVQFGSQVGSTLAEIATAVYEKAKEIGSKIGSGIIDGVKSIAGSIKDAVVGTVTGAFSAAGSFLHGSGPWQFTIHSVGVPLADGVIRGFLLGMSTLPSTVSSTVRSALERGRTVITAMQSRLVSAFDRLAEMSMRAFDARTQEMIDNLIVQVRSIPGVLTGFSFAEGEETPAERQLRMEREAREQMARERELAEAQASGDAQRIADAEWAIREAALEAEAAQERKAAEEALAEGRKNLTARRERKRQQLEDELQDLRTYLSKHPDEWRKVHRQLMKMFKKEFGPDFKSAAKNIGQAFADGLEEAFRAVAAAATKFANELGNYLKGNSPPKKGPLRGITNWGRNVAEAYAEGIGAARIGGNFVRSLAPIGPSSLQMAPAYAGGGGGTSVFEFNVNAPVYGAGGERALFETFKREYAEYLRTNPPLPGVAP